MKKRLVFILVPVIGLALLAALWLIGQLSAPGGQTPDSETAEDYFTTPTPGGRRAHGALYLRLRRDP